jgi:hypothetical protein
MNGNGAKLRLGTQLSQQTTFQGNIAPEETNMVIGYRLKELRESKELSQGTEGEAEPFRKTVHQVKTVAVQSL